MEPRQQEQMRRVEQTPLPPVGGEYSLPGYEAGQERQQERVHEVGEAPVEAAQVVMPALPMPVLSVPTTNVQVPAATDSSLVAGDDDLIEKEWVDKAKSIIAATKDDPYRREQEISKLQIEYIRKRYGRTIGTAGD